MKRKLLLAALCVVSALGFKAQAQTWTSSEVGAGSFYIYNVGAKGYIVAGNNYGTRASINAQGGILTTFASQNGAYTISTASTYAGKYLGADGYVDQGLQEWIFEPVAGETNVYKMKKSDGKYLYADEGATTTSLGGDPGTDYAKWKLVTRANRIADLEANASKDNPIDATFLLANPNFDRSSTTSMWTGGVALGGNQENFCAEKFNTTFDVNQTVTDAPKGAYALAFQGFYRYGGHGIDPAGNARKNGTEVLNTKLYANDTEAPLMSILDETTAGGGSTYGGIAYPNNMNEASTAFSKGLYSTSMDFTVDVNTIKIGVKKTVTVENDWTIFDNARLTYYGPVVDFTIYKTNLQTQVDKAEALYGKLPTAAETNLKNTVSQYNKEYDNVDGYITAIAAIKSAVELAEAIADSYATCKSLIATATTLVEGYSNLTSGLPTVNAAVEAATDAETINGYNDQLNSAIKVFSNWLKIKAAANSLIPVANDNAEANSTLSNAYNTQEAAVQTATLATVAKVVPTAVDELTEACRTYVFTANPVGDGAQFDMTFLMTNPDLTGLPTWAECDGWTSEETDGNFQVMVNDSKTNDGKSYFYEYWSDHAKASGKFALYNAVTLPAGTYAMSCYAFAEDQYTQSTVNGVYFYANDTQGSCVIATVLTEQTLEFNNAEEQEVKIGLKTLTGNTRNWMGIGYVKLYKVPANTTAYAINVSATNANVTVTVAGQDATECLPLETVTLDITPGEDYYVTNVTVTYDGGTCDVANPSGNTYTFQMPKAEVTVTVDTEEKDVVEMVITDAKWATFIAPFDVTIPEGVIAYTVNTPETGSNELNLTPWETTIPANIPVVLSSENTVNQLMKGIANATEQTYTEGLLTGVYADTEITEGYVLQKQDNVVAFYKVDATAAITVPANRAYLNAPANAANVRGFFFPEAGEATGIAGLEVLTSGNYDAIYTAGGAKVNSLQKGLNIVVKDGKSYKIFVK